MDKKIIVLLMSLSFIVVPVMASAVINCRLVSGKNYYTDGVSNFKDSSCRQEMTDAEVSASASSTNTAATLVATGNANCRYNTSRQQFTDGTSFFTDNKCTKEALNGETAIYSATSVATASTAASALPASISASQFAQLSLRIDNLEKRLAGLQTLLVQLLSLLTQLSQK